MDITRIIETRIKGIKEISAILLTVVGDGWKDQKIDIQYGV